MLPPKRKSAKVAKKAKSTKAPKAARKAKAPKKATKKAAKEAPAKRASPPKGPKYQGEVVRLLFPMDKYEAGKKEVKAPLKAHGLKWQYLGPGQGRYFSERANVFAKFGDAHVDYTLRGDPAVVDDLAAAWRALGAEDFTEEAAAAEEAEEVKAWRIAMPVRRPGEPEGFYNRRMAEWEALDPRKK